MKCIHCEADDIENDDNFCWNCGHWTARGYRFLKDEENVKNILNGDVFKTEDRFSTMLVLLSLAFIGFTAMLLIRGDDLFKPFTYLKKQAVNYIYGYKTSTMKTDNKYTGEYINDYNDAIEFIKKDFTSQSWLCENDIDVGIVQYELEDNYSIPSVSFCDMSLDEANKIKAVIDRMYMLFPNIKGALTNITITNAQKNSDYVARFQPMYQFVNISENINEYNKVNKTQILLNSYYFLNQEIMNNPVESIVGEDWYVDGVTWESTIAHELGHYISFLILLKENNLNNITFVTSSNSSQIDNLLEQFNSGEFSNKLLNEAVENYNNVYGTNLDNISFANTISKYASSKDKKGNLIADETIAEAIHDYYLHGYMMKQSSSEIINVIKQKL